MVQVTICCVQAGNYQGRGTEYVNNLFDMVVRNFPEKQAFQFVCFTDNPEGLQQGIEARELPVPGLRGWWNKLSLFKEGVFENGERIIFFDLDTLIVWALDEIIKYQGEFACLRDFYRPDGLGSGVMLWEAGKYTDIWETWDLSGRPEIEGGDQIWIEKIVPNAKRLQDEFPGSFISYKAHCNPFPTPHASVVCFHGEPRPHNCTQKWVRDTWKVGGSSALNITTAPNTSTEKVLRNVRLNENAAKWIGYAPEHEEVAVICGSGPSLKDSMDHVRFFLGKPAKIFALNNAAKFLHEEGVTPDFQVILDARKDNTVFVDHQYASSYLIASQCDPEIFKAIEGKEVYLWHPVIDGIDELFPDRKMTLIGGGTTIGLSAIALAYTMGFRKFALFGYDSSFKDESTHVLPQSRTPQEANTFDVSVGDRSFKSNAAMAKQAELFPQFCSHLTDLGCEFAVFGDGLLPYIAQRMSTT